MNNEFILALKEIEQEKGIGVDVILEAIASALVSAYKKNYDSTLTIDVKIDKESGQIDVYSKRIVVDEDDNEYGAEGITLEEAKKIKPDAVIGDTVEYKEKLKDFGRIAAQTARQVVASKLREAEKGIIYSEFSSRESDMITGVVDGVEKGVCNLIIDNINGIIEGPEQIPDEEYVIGERIKAYILEVRNTAKGPIIIASRSHSGLLKRLFEAEVPEIHDGIVEIKSIAREAGQRSKISVASSNPEVDSVGSCVGQDGSRVKAIVNELNGEKIDIIQWSENPADYIAAALSPSDVVDVQTLDEEGKATVIVPDNQLSLAIGKEGQNARLAAKLTQWKIDIKSETQAQEAGIVYENKYYRA